MPLLAHLYSHIRGSQEDIATLSLQYILSYSQDLNHAFTSLLYLSMNLPVIHGLNYVCQSVGKKLERPDISGVNETGNEMVLCEAKFYAGLTENQPLAYLERLRNDKGHGLVFICPSMRKNVLWSQLLIRCNGCRILEIKDYCADVDSIRMSIITWNEIIEILKKTSAAHNNIGSSDIDQLEGFCRQMDQEAFIPFAKEDFGSLTPRKEERYYQTIDALIDVIKKDGILETSSKGVKATANRYGYSKSIRINGYWVTVNYDRKLWQNSNTVETPFWFTIRNSKWEQTDSLKKYLNSINEMEKEFFWNAIFVALHPLTNSTLDEVTNDLKNQILSHIKKYEELEYIDDKQG